MDSYDDVDMQAATAAHLDPYDLSVEHVAQYFEAVVYNVVDRQVIAECIRRNGINGSILLDYLDKTTVERDLGLTSIGHKAAIMNVVRDLRTQSPRYITLERQRHALQLAITSGDPQSTIIRRRRPPEVLLALMAPRRESLPHSQPPASSTATQPKATKRGRLLQVNDAGKLPLNSRAYLTSGCTDLESFFYGSADEGAELGHSEASEDDDWSLPSTAEKRKIPEGLRHFTSRRVQYFLRREFEPVKKDPTRQIARPYPRHLATSSRKGQIVSVLTNSGQLTKGNPETPNIASGLERPANDNGNDDEWDYDFLLRRRDREHSAEISMLDGAESISVSSSFAAELQEEEKIQPEQRLLNSVEKNAAVDAALDKFQNDWRQKKMPRLEAKAYKYWQEKKSASSAMRAREEIERLKTRLQCMRNDIVREEWKSVAEITKQCSLMDLSVFEQLKTEWKINLWKSGKVPPKPKSVPRPKKPSARNHADDDNNEFLTSGSEDAAAASNDFADIDDIVEMGGVAGAHPNEDVDMEDAFEHVDLHSDFLSISDAISTRSHERAKPIGTTTGIIDMTSEFDVLDQAPEEISPENAAAWDFGSLEESRDFKRLILKLLNNTPDRRRALFSRMFRSAKGDEVPMNSIQLGILMRGACSALDILARKNMSQAEKKQGIRFVDLALLFICWVELDHRYWYEEGRPPISSKFASTTVQNMQNDGHFRTFCEFLERIRCNFDKDKTVAKTQASPEPEKSSERASDAGSDIEVLYDAVEDYDSPRKRRKRAVKQSLTAKAMRDMADNRLREENDRRQKNMLKLRSSGLQASQWRKAINPGKKDDEEFIYIPDSIASQIKDHQLEGVRFLWREIVTSDEKSAQGCLLAHTMGLGKTMQAITLLATLEQAIANDETRKQIPAALRSFRVVILLPPSLIENWVTELEKWAPENSVLHTPFALAANDKKPILEKSRRYDLIRDWAKERGVLLIGYDMFRNVLLNKPNKFREPPYSPLQQEHIRTWLLEKPSLLVADEAHKMKNAGSGIGFATAGFKKHRRVALTGSPLSNNLLEYYAMINWVAPGFLGDQTEFKAWYKEPIEAGLYSDSTGQEQRKSLKMLKTLKRVIDTKVHRADISVLRDDLKPKTEFVLNIGLTPLQLEIYNLFVKWLYSDAKFEDVAVGSVSKLWGIMSILSQLLVDPWLFSEALKDRLKTKAQHVAETEHVAEKDDDEQVELVQDAAKNQSLVNQVNSLMENHGVQEELTDISHKLRLILRITQLSKQAGDRVLIFSRRLRTLTTIEKYLKKNNLSTLRLDGATQMGARQHMSNTFGTADSDADALVISTKAGGLGLNMIGASRVILVDFGFDPTAEEQAVGRAYRIGQPKHVYVYHLVVGGTFETPLHSMTVFKKQLASRVVDSRSMVRTGLKTRDFVFPPNVLEGEDMTEYRGKDVRVMDKLLDEPAGQEAIRSMATTETLHVEIEEELTEQELHEVEQLIAQDRQRVETPNSSHALPSIVMGMTQANLQLQESQYQLLEEARLRHVARSTHENGTLFHAIGGQVAQGAARWTYENIAPVHAVGGQPARSEPSMGPVFMPATTLSNYPPHPRPAPLSTPSGVNRRGWHGVLGQYATRPSFLQLFESDEEASEVELQYLKQKAERDPRVGTDFKFLLMHLRAHRAAQQQVRGLMGELGRSGSMTGRALR